jgi:hypothetical protein
MALLETLTLQVGPAIAKAILKFWLKDSRVASDITASLMDFIKSKTTDVIAQQRAKRQFEEIGERVAESLLPVFEIEGTHLEEGARAAVAYAVARTLDKSRIDPKLIVERDLEPTKLVEHMTAANPSVAQHFSAAEMALYQRIISEACQYIVDIASQPTARFRNSSQHRRPWTKEVSVCS